MTPKRPYLARTPDDLRDERKDDDPFRGIVISVLISIPFWLIVAALVVWWID
jgi:hypothetical protein